MNTTKLLTSLTVTTALLCSAAFAADTLKVSMEDGKQRVEFSLHGKTGCVLVDAKVYCALATARAPLRLASSTSD
ncbi:MAG: hypothetical protein AABM64_03665 [Pseudomonadota bacterium]